MSTQHLLMIEDDARLAAMVGEYLTQSGFVVTYMPDGELAWARCRTSRSTWWCSI